MSFIETFFNKLNEFNNFYIDIINFERISVLEQLKKIERTGKVIRINKLDKEIKIRTVYDHVCSLGYTAKIFIDNNLLTCNYDTLSSLIISHDLCEIFITDYPDYTKNYHEKSISLINVLNVPKKEREEYATRFIWLFANENQKCSLNNMFVDSEEKKILSLIDKIDPIINTWRYMHYYSEKLKKTNYIDAMNDFFTNPVLDNIANEYRDTLFEEIVNYLKNKENAKLYLDNDALNKKILSNRAYKIIKYLIEDVPLFF